MSGQIVAEICQFTLFVFGFSGLGAYIIVKEGPQNHYIGYILFGIAGLMMLYALFCLTYRMMRQRFIQKPDVVLNANPLDIGDDPSNPV